MLLNLVILVFLLTQNLLGLNLNTLNGIVTKTIGHYNQSFLLFLVVMT